MQTCGFFLSVSLLDLDIAHVMKDKKKAQQKEKIENVINGTVLYKNSFSLNDFFHQPASWKMFNDTSSDDKQLTTALLVFGKNKMYNLALVSLCALSFSSCYIDVLCLLQFTEYDMYRCCSKCSLSWPCVRATGTRQRQQTRECGALGLQSPLSPGAGGYVILSFGVPHAWWSSKGGRARYWWQVGIVEVLCSYVINLEG